MPKFSIKKNTNMVLKHFTVTEKHFKANLLFPIMIPLTHPITHILGDLKHFETMFFFH